MDNRKVAQELVKIAKQLSGGDTEDDWMKEYARMEKLLNEVKRHMSKRKKGQHNNSNVINFRWWNDRLEDLVDDL